MASMPTSSTLRGCRTSVTVRAVVAVLSVPLMPCVLRVARAVRPGRCRRPRINVALHDGGCVKGYPCSMTVRRFADN